MSLCTYNSSSLGGFDERKRAVIGFFRHVDETLLQLIFPQDALQLVQSAHPLRPLLLVVGQDQDARLLTRGGGQLRCCYLWNEWIALHMRQFKNVFKLNNETLHKAIVSPVMIITSSPGCYYLICDILKKITIIVW